MNIFSRILKFIDYKGISKNKFSEKIGLSNSYMSKMVANNGNIGSQIIEKIVRIYPELDARWLLTGEGNMIINQDNKQNQNEPEMNCDNCPYKELISRYQEDIDRYREEISELREENRSLRHQEQPERKRRSA